MATVAWASPRLASTTARADQPGGEHFDHRAHEHSGLAGEPVAAGTADRPGRSSAGSLELDDRVLLGGHRDQWFTGVNCISHIGW